MDSDLVGTFDEDDDDQCMVGFLTFREKFNEEDEAKEYRERMKQMYRVGTSLSSKWSWGRFDEDATRILGSNAIVHMVKYMNKEVPIAKDVIRTEQKEKLQFKGKVTEPV